MSSLPNDYSAFLTSNGLSKSSIRNYLAHVSVFPKWFEAAYSRSFIPAELRPEHIQGYETFMREKNIPATSIKRAMASLKKFRQWANPHHNLYDAVAEEVLQGATPRQTSQEESPILSAHKAVDEFEVFLNNLGLSKSTIANYIADLSRFIRWYETAGRTFVSSVVKDGDVLAYQIYLGFVQTPRATRKRIQASLGQFLKWVHPAKALEFMIFCQ